MVERGRHLLLPSGELLHIKSSLARALLGYDSLENDPVRIADLSLSPPLNRMDNTQEPLANDNDSHLYYQLNFWDLSCRDREWFGSVG